MDGLEGVEEIWHAVRDDKAELKNTKIERHCWNSRTLSDCKRFGTGVQIQWLFMYHLSQANEGRSFVIHWGNHWHLKSVCKMPWLD